jgi:hypothetical protein
VDSAVLRDVDGEAEGSDGKDQEGWVRSYVPFFLE